MKTTSTLFLAATLSVAGGFALAQEATTEDTAGGMEGMDHSNMEMGGAMDGMMTAMDTMMQAMPTESSGMVDADFLLMMIPHHQSAIDMARVELEQGEDEATKTMAQEIIDAQEAEIAEMRTMLEGMGVESPAAPAE